MQQDEAKAFNFKYSVLGISSKYSVQPNSNVTKAKKPRNFESPLVLSLGEFPLFSKIIVLLFHCIDLGLSMCFGWIKPTLLEPAIKNSLFLFKKDPQTQAALQIIFAAK